jgi:hypothetical protein
VGTLPQVRKLSFGQEQQQPDDEVKLQQALGALQRGQDAS